MIRFGPILCLTAFLNVQQDVKFRMDVYTAETGVEMTLTWRSAERLRRAIEFLADKNTPVASHGAQEVPFCYLETRQQLKELFDFQKSLEGRR